MNWCITFIVGLFFAISAHASCWEEAAEIYKVDPQLLKSISWTESRGRSDAVGPPIKGGHRALGHMQINTVHLPTLQKYGITKNDLFNSCLSTKLGAWVLADCMEKFGNTWKAVGCYNTGPYSKNVPAQLRYVTQVQKYYKAYSAKGEPKTSERTEREIEVIQVTAQSMPDNNEVPVAVNEEE
jgi:soluble lytic murein transglycosylase-like protein